MNAQTAADLATYARLTAADTGVDYATAVQMFADEPGEVVADMALAGLVVTAAEIREWAGRSGAVVTMAAPGRAGANLLEMINETPLGRLTCDHAASSHGLPVLVLDSGGVLGAAEAGVLTVLAVDAADPIVTRARDAGYVIEVAP